jgi:ArsR family transcriptional regulator, lead/cadmium/zinc/bismuth-responsive transcriptional repressor
MNESTSMLNRTPKCLPADHACRRKIEVDRDACERAAAIFRALGDTARLQMLVMLSEGDLCVTEIADRLGDNLSAVSQRLKLLRGERIVRQRREGKHIFYSFADRHVAEMISNALAHAEERTGNARK